MMKRGFSLIELAVTILIASLLLHGAFDLLRISMNRFARQEESVVCAGEAAMLSSYLLRDLESALLKGEDRTPAGIIAQIGCEASGLKLPGPEGTVIYKHDADKKTIVRAAGAQTARLGESYVAEFSIAAEIQTADGKIASFSSFSAPNESQSAIRKIWFRFNVIMAGNSSQKPPVRQVYSFYAFPVTLNRQLQSIWKP